MIVFPEKLAETPVGKPVGVPIPVAPVVVIVMFVIVALGHMLGVELAANAVFKFLIPLRAMFEKVVPETAAKFPLNVPPVAVEFNLTYTVVAVTVPLVGVKVIDVENPLPEVNEISYPLGAVKIKFEPSPVADTDAVCSEEAVPAHVEYPERDDGVTTILAFKFVAVDLKIVVPLA